MDVARSRRAQSSSNTELVRDRELVADWTRNSDLKVVSLAAKQLKRVGGAAACCGLLCLCFALITTPPTGGASRVTRETIAGRGNTPLRVLLRLPHLALRFEPNVGQTNPIVRYQALGNGYRIALSERGVKLELATELALPEAPSHHASPTGRQLILGLRFVQSNPHPRLEAERPEGSVSNYLMGNRPSRWHLGIPNFANVRYTEIYPGVDWVLYGHQDELEYDFVIAPGADPRRIRFRFDGADRLSVDPHGDLLIQAKQHAVRQRRPVVYQRSATGDREYIEARYALDHRDVRLVLASYDRRRELVIDPALAFSTYLGGSGGDYASAIAVDGAGNVYVAGVTTSVDFPTLQPFQAANPGQAAFVSKLNAAGTALVFSTYLGGASEVAGIAVDATGNVYVAGTTSSANFPVQNAFQPTYKGSGAGSVNGFVTKLDPSGEALVYSTYLGGSVQDFVHGLAVDNAGAVYVAGQTSSPDFPIANALQPTLKGRLNAFLTKLNADGGSLAFSTFLGGSAADGALAVALDTTSTIYLGGETNSVDFPTVNAFQSVNHASANGSTDPTGFVAKINQSGNALVYASYLGGSGVDAVRAIAADSAGNAYVTGSTSSTDFPTVSPLQSTNRAATGLGGPTAFVSKINSAGNALVYSTYLGGSGGGNGPLGDVGNAIAIDNVGGVVAVGQSSSTDFPVVGAVQTTNKAAALGASNAFVSELNSSGNALLFSTYLGGSGSYGNQQAHTTIPFGDSAAAVALDSSGNIYVAGQTGSSDFPIMNPFQSMNRTETQYGTVSTAFVSKFGTEVGIPPSTTRSGGGGGGSLDWESLFIVIAVVLRGWVEDGWNRGAQNTTLPVRKSRAERVDHGIRRRP
jgi:hypothetical protein